MISREHKNLGFGAGFRKKHRARFFEAPTKLDWLEVISENYLGMNERDPSPLIRTLEKLRRDYPIAMHGVSMSIGSSDPLDMSYLQRLKSIIDRIQPETVSDHICWTSIGGDNLHDLLPLPYRNDVIQFVSNRIKRVQDFLGRKILLENVSSYMTFAHSEMQEWDFVKEISEGADCGILLDINNVYVNSRNHGFDPIKYINEIPSNRVGQIHLAGHSDEGTHLVDTHDHPVSPGVWELYRSAIKRFGSVSTMIEWDDNIPEFDELEAEVMKAKKILERSKDVKDQSVTL